MTALLAPSPGMLMPARERRLDAAAGAYELGNEPAIEADGRRHSELDRRRVSMHWLSGTILTGCAGAVLIGAAIYAALDRQSKFAEAPAFASPQRRDAVAGELVNPKKGDRLVKSVDIVAARQSFRTPTTITVGDKEIVRVRAFTRVATTLTMAPTGFSDDVPPFNPLRLLSDNQNAPVEAAPADTGPVQDDAEVSFITRDLGADTPAPAGAGLSLDEVRAQITEQLRAAVAAPGLRSSLPLPPQLLLMRTSRVGLESSPALGYAAPNLSLSGNPFSSIDVRMVPENVSLVPRAIQTTAPAADDERLVLLRRGDTFEDVLKSVGATKEQIRAIVAAFDLRRGQSPATEGQRVKILLCDIDGNGVASQIARLSVYSDETMVSTVALDDSGNYVQVAHTETPATQPAKAASEDDEEDADAGGMKLYDSLYETALKQDIPRTTINDLVRIFANDVDFQRPVAAGDSFEAFYEESEDGEAHNELLYASITTRNETFKYFRYQTPDDNAVDYYDENGRSTRKFLVRQPIAAGRLSSGFGGRYHPILGYTRMHTGVDWAAPIGTPIFAAGNGTVIKAGRESGYGNRVEIQHANGYVTTYNHMSGFARGIAEGMRIRQGQVVGYLGMTGLATGPHLHYEVIVNGHFVDPLRVKLARTRELDGRMSGLFRREKDRIESLIAKAPNAPRVVATKGG